MRGLAAAGDARLSCSVQAVSGWCPAEHLDHCAKVARLMLEVVNSAGALPAGNGISTLGRVILIFGWIPRGRGKAPKRVFGSRVDGAALLASLQEVEELVERVDAAAVSRSRVPVVPHPKFGGLTGDEALRFIDIHNRHHLRIITDIERAARA